MLRLRLALAVALVALPTAGATGAPLGATRLRPQSTRIAGWLSLGLERSPTMRALVDHVARGDVVVYLEILHTLDPDMAACVTWMAAVPGARYVRVSMRPNLRAPEAIAMLAHELQHVVEVIEHPDVRSGASLAALYERIGHRTGVAMRTFDTVAALRAGDTARVEMVRGVQVPLRSSGA